MLVILFVGLASGLLIGALLGVAAVDKAPRPGTDATPEPTVVAGTIERLPSGHASGSAFKLDLRNGGVESVEVSGLRFDGLDSDLVAEQDALLRPGVWRSVVFGATVDCSLKVPRTLGSVLLTLRTPEGEREQEIPLPGGGRSLVEYHAAVCAQQVMPRARDLVGVWVVAEALGSQDRVGIMVLRFGRDGSFVADPAGLALRHAAEHGVEGRYSLEGGELRVDIDGGYMCSRGDSATWRPSMVVGPRTTSLDEQPRMTIAWVGGECSDEMDGQIWTLHRVLDDAQ